MEFINYKDTTTALIFATLDIFETDKTDRLHYNVIKNRLKKYDHGLGSDFEVCAALAVAQMITFGIVMTQDTPSGELIILSRSLQELKAIFITTIDEFKDIKKTAEQERMDVIKQHRPYIRMTIALMGVCFSFFISTGNGISILAAFGFIFLTGAAWATRTWNKIAIRYEAIQKYYDLFKKCGLKEETTYKFLSEKDLL